FGRDGPHGGGGNPAQSDAGPTDDAVDDVHGEPDGNGGDVVEAALGDLVERRALGEGEGQTDLADQLIGLPDRLPVAGEVLGQGHDPLATGTREDESSVEGEQGRGAVADR